MAETVSDAVVRGRLGITPKVLEAYCRRWKIAEFRLFGSVLRDDFGPDSDIDVLITHAPDAEWSLWDTLDMEDELSALVGRKVDIIKRDGLMHGRNPLRRQIILDTARPFYVAA